jgi:hypothetical protein
MTELIDAIVNSRMLQLGLATTLGLSINLMLGVFGQQWTALKSQRYASIVLPPAGAIITWTISSNLALSLGMIGALSIVRFRTPVKNPFELVTFFCYLILGISAGVNPRYTIALAAVVIATPVVVAIVDSVLSLLGSGLSRRLRSRAEFASAPVQLIAQLRCDRVEVPSGIPTEDVISIASQPEVDSGKVLMDLTVSFDSKGEAIKCLGALDKENLAYSSVRSMES